MSEESQNLRSFLQAVRRHKILVGVLLLLGLIAGGGYSVEKPPMLTSSALVLLPASVHNVATEALIAASDPVLGGAAHNIDPQPSLQGLQSNLQVKSVTSNMLQITAQGKTAALAEQTANAVAGSYKAYIGSANAPGGKVQASILERAANATGTTLAVRAATTAFFGALIGVLLGTIIAVALSRGDRRLRHRDDIADTVGVPVLASMQVAHPRDPGAWTRLLEDYQPRGAVEALRLRSALDHLGLADQRGASGTSLTVLSLSRDPGALAIGPQIAAYAASLGIPTTLVFGSQQVSDAAATLQAACAALQKQARPLGKLWVTVSDHNTSSGLADVGFTVVVAVLDSQSPNAASTIRTMETVLALSSGVATAEQVARVAASALADQRPITGIFVADPDPADRTTGRLPEVGRPGHRRTPTRALGRSVETRK